MPWYIPPIPQPPHQNAQLPRERLMARNAGRDVASGLGGFDQPVVFLGDAPPAVGGVARAAGVGDGGRGEGEGG